MEEQAADRVHRLGQTREVVVYRWVWEGLAGTRVCMCVCAYRGARVEGETARSALARRQCQAGASLKTRVCSPAPQPHTTPTALARRYVVSSSIEERMLDLQEQKRDLANVSRAGVLAAALRLPGFAVPRSLTRSLPAGYHARPTAQVAFDRRRVEEMRAARISDVRMLMEL